MLAPLSRRRFLSLGLGSAAIAACGAATSHRNAAIPLNSNLRTFNRTSWALGADVSLTVLHDDESSARAALNAAFVELDSIENVLSLYRSHSQISRLNRDGCIDFPHTHLSRVLDASLDMSRLSHGAFDATVQPLWDLYFAAKKRRALPSAAEIYAARGRVDWTQIVCSPERIHFKIPGMALTFNGIAQGYAADRVVNVLQAHGIQHALVDTGEFEARGRKAGGEPFHVGIQHPRKPGSLAALCALDARALATSGDYATTFSDDFVYHHIFNPATGRSPSELSSVSIVAPTGMTADALTKPVFVLGIQKGLELLQSLPGCEGYLIAKSGQTFSTKNFPLV